MGEPYDTFDLFRLAFEALAALVGAFYFFKLKSSYWKWFSIYLVFIIAQEMLWYKQSFILDVSVRQYFAYFGYPIQFIFFYWLYALKSLRNPKLFALCVSIYMLTLFFKIFFEKTDWVYSFNINIGTILLMMLMVMEFIKQIKNDNILQFWQNKMFYINIGLVLFYAGTYPFHVFQTLLYKQYIDIWKGYYLYFLIANCTMYLLFSASFIWGKEKS